MNKQILIHTASMVQIEIAGKTNVEIIEEIALEGLKMGKTSLSKLLSGEVSTTCGFELIEVAVQDEAPVEQAQLSLEIPEEVLVEVATEQAVEVVEEDAPMAIEEPKVEEVAPVVEEVKTLKTMRKDTKMHKAAIALCEGVTIKEIMAQFGYSEGGAGATVFCRQAGIISKGYDLIKEKVEGRGTVLFLAIDGQRITTEQILVK